MPRLNAQRLQGECDDAIGALHRLRADLPELLRRVEEMTRDGYPTSSFGNGSGTGGAARPTEQAALAPVAPDPVKAYVRRIIHVLDKLGHDATALDGLRAVALEAPGADRMAVVDTCGNCGGPEMRRLRDGRCWPCFEYRRRTSRERPPSLWDRRVV